MIEIYADGAYNPVSKHGAWASVIIDNAGKRSFSGLVEATSNSRMEIMAVIEGLEHIPEAAEVTVYTDSQYVYNCASQGWKRRVNLDLWQRLDHAAGARKVHWQWINGDVANPHHQEAHDIATGLATKAGTKEPTDIPKPETPAAASELSHLDAEGRPRMVDVTEKADTEREAVARCQVVMKPETLVHLKKGDLPKGEVLTVAQVAGIMAAKRTPDLIPMCHPLLLGSIKVEFKITEPDTVEITSRVKNTGKTGVEMEALTAASVTALTIYDMCKAVDKGMRITNLRLVRKSGGKSGTIVLEPE